MCACSDSSGPAGSNDNFAFDATAAIGTGRCLRRLPKPFCRSPAARIVRVLGQDVRQAHFEPAEVERKAEYRVLLEFVVV